MDDQLRIILIIIVSVSIFGLLVFVFVKNYIRNKIQYYLEEKNKNKVQQEAEQGIGGQHRSARALHGDALGPRRRH